MMPWEAPRELYLYLENYIYSCIYYVCIGIQSDIRLSSLLILLNNLPYIQIWETFSESYPSIWSILYCKFNEHPARIGLDGSQY